MRILIITGNPDTDETVSEMERDFFTAETPDWLHQHLVWAFNQGHTVQLSTISMQLSKQEKKYMDEKKKA